MTDDFVQPSISTGIDLQSLVGALLVLSVISVEDHVPTVHTIAGEKSPAVKADVYAIDGPQAGKEFPGALIFPKVLQSQLKSNVGRKVVGRLGMADPKPGKNPAWTLNAATDADLQAARSWNASRQRSAAPSSASRAPF